MGALHAPRPWEHRHCMDCGKPLTPSQATVSVLKSDDVRCPECLRKWEVSKQERQV